MKDQYFVSLAHGLEHFKETSIFVEKDDCYSTIQEVIKDLNCVILWIMEQ